MSNERGLLAELRRHNLLRPLLRQRIIQEAVGDEQVTTEDLDAARNKFLQKNQLKDDETLNTYLKGQGWTREDLEWQLSLPFRIKSYCQKEFLHKSEAHFLTRKNQLDQVVYSLIRTKDRFLAQELYLRIAGGESNFADLAAQFSEGAERNTKGIIGPVPMTQAHPTVAELLRTTKPGVLISPVLVADWHLVIRLESYRPSNFDEEMAQRLSKELFDQWINDELDRKMATLNETAVATAAE